MPRDQRRQWWFLKEGLDVFVMVTDPKNPDLNSKTVGQRLLQKGRGMAKGVSSLKTKVIAVIVSRQTHDAGPSYEEGVKVC
jgi:hypothetical protein